MNLAMEKEIKKTVIVDKGKAYYESWIKTPPNEREKVRLVVSFDMGWQKRASRNSYSSRSGYTFVVGMHTRRIIDCVVFSTNCKKCEIKEKTEPIEEEDFDSGLWRSALFT